MKFLRGFVILIIFGFFFFFCWFEGRGGGLFLCKWFGKFLFYKWLEKNVIINKMNFLVYGEKEFLKFVVL